MKYDMHRRIDRKWATLGRVGLRVLLAGRGVYQPVLVGGKVVAAGARAAETRAETLRKLVADTGAASVLDLGCAEGYMVRRCAEGGVFAIGVDGDARRLAVAQLSLTIDGVEGFGFIKSPITAETVPQFPSADVTVFLSVLHHLMYEHGVETSRDLLVAIRRRTDVAMLFEMGQSDERSAPWVAGLPDMGRRPHEWIAEFLDSAGYSQIEKVAEAPAYHGDVARAIFVVRPS